MIQSKLTATGMLARFAFFAINIGVLLLPILLIEDKASILKWCFSILVYILFVLISPIAVLTTRKISIGLDIITYANWLTGKVKIYNFNDLDGYVTIIKSRRVIGALQEEDFESVILVKESKRVGEISSYYYSNYDELIDGLKDLKYLGREDYNIVNRFKDYFNELIK